MFYTLTANPAVDMTVSCNGLIPNENIRSGSASYTPNGKGLDVSFALKKFGTESVALGFFAGFTGKFIVEETMNMGCLCRPVWTDGITRINVYINDGESEYGVLNPGAPLTPEYQQELYKVIDTAGNLDCLVVSGSLPPRSTEDFLDQVMEHAQVRGADVVLDLSSKKLEELAEKRPLLIKPNHHELHEIFDLPVRDDEDVRRAMAHLHGIGIQNVLLTMGSKGSAYFSNGEDIWFAQRDFNIKLVSSVCAGDCTLAAFLTKWYEERDNVECAMKLALATGANVAESVGLGDFARVDEYSKRIKVRKLDRL
ncbi:1-phosphofructokinase [Coriobacterium glomerans PW2]|uniref:1-phosphofructokinase n=1 Tax=Coriobacterium glomerans (strain ATCC 49209 / DSM 20642 / JCM 10262 / PW2) TaxID=700015 RepID=F2N832_CORGP|nr:1-phosphofructokinase [Coriobacterium glomerans]AEB07215.1 1-phosphofructokinase [Coriobacterium glomerans PW2]